MSHLGELPHELTEALTIASNKIGSQRAIIALQGIAHEHRKHTLIDGILREETIVGVRIAGLVVGNERLVEQYKARICERFPEVSFTEETEDTEESSRQKRRRL